MEIRELRNIINDIWKPPLEREEGDSISIKEEIIKKATRLKGVESIKAKDGYKGLEEAVKKVIEDLRSRLDRKIEITVDKDLGRMVVKILDEKTGDLIRQIPPEEILAISKRLKDMEGIFIDREV